MSDTHKTYVCIVCGFTYDEAAGRPEDGIADGGTDRSDRRLADLAHAVMA